MLHESRQDAPAAARNAEPKTAGKQRAGKHRKLHSDPPPRSGDGPSKAVVPAASQPRRGRQRPRDSGSFAGSVVESIPVPIAVLHEDCTIRAVNAAFCRLLQMQAKALKGRSLSELAQLLWGLEGMGQRLQALVGSPPGTPIEFEHESATQPRKSLLIKAQAFAAEGGRGLLMMIEDVTLRREAERLSAQNTEALESRIATAARTLARTQEEQRGLAGHLMESQEHERQWIARELHDDVSQRLSVLAMLFSEIDHKNLPPLDAQRIRQAQALLDALNTDVRQISHRLHPAILSDLGLSAALRALVDEFRRHEQMPAAYQARELPESWPPEAATAIYRIAQEALHNVAKYAGKTRVEVVLSGSPQGLQLTVMDFGIGFNQEVHASTSGLGMISMQERARLAGGTLEVRSALGQGAVITVTIPLDHRHDQTTSSGR